jgi:hypothetical protein
MAGPPSRLPTRVLLEGQPSLTFSLDHTHRHVHHTQTSKAMKRNVATSILAVLAIMSVRVASAYPGIVGETVSLTRELPSWPYTLGPIVFVAQEGSADTVALTIGNNLYVNVEDNSLLFSFGPSSGSGGPFPPMGHFILFQELSPTAPTIRAVTYQTDLTGFATSDISFTAHSVTVGYGGIDYSGGQYLTVNLQLVPEPCSFTLSGFGATLLIAFRSRTQCRTRE